MEYLFFESKDFFGPKADSYKTQILGDKPVEPLIPPCGKRVAGAIDELAKRIAQSSDQERRFWQRRDGSIIYENLSPGLKWWFEGSDFDEQGYINLDKLHIYTLDEVQGMQKAGWNCCKLPGCLDKKIELDKFVTCRALSERLQQTSSSLYSVCGSIFALLALAFAARMARPAIAAVSARIM